jgi:hypothetical protein
MDDMCGSIKLIKCNTVEYSQLSCSNIVIIKVWKVRKKCKSLFENIKSFVTKKKNYHAILLYVKNK